jgi:hypothetical protein
MSEPLQLPTSLNQLKLKLGREVRDGGPSILQGSNIPAWAMNRPTKAEYIAAAEKWRQAYDDQLSSLAQMIKRALPYLPEDKEGALNSLMSDDWSDTFGISDFMASVEPPYIRNVYMMAFTAEPAAMKAGLEILAEFCEGR